MTNFCGADFAPGAKIISHKVWDIFLFDDEFLGLHNIYSIRFTLSRLESIRP